ncbi:hypothetical protein C1645_815635 [Glomus cerebriforme]|uniref:Uncharacterized protein n=1 Tax=Glomus cerebriforme TaxID=658196 RepID=A0A397TD73_9GLOM|nr:hypothetical protein C1645_815635 [Glomus cerebriforme]
MERAYHLNILEWMWKRMTGKFKRKEEIIKWKYRGKIGAKSENDYMKKYPCGLDSKADMPYDKMWKIYSEAKKSPSSTTVRNMREKSPP